MFNKLFDSIVFRIGSMMFLISFVAIISMFSSVFISDLADQDALVINEAGALRKQSYKILVELELIPLLQVDARAKQQNKLTASITDFDAKITSQTLASNATLLGHKSIKDELEAIQDTWFSSLKNEIIYLASEPEKLNAEQLIKLNSTMEAFVSHIDTLVTLYQQSAEQRISLIRMILGISLFITTLLAAFTMIQISRRVEKPLSDLTRSAKKIMGGDYSTTTNIQQNDELGLLAETMNKMSQALSHSYGELEQRVQTKTKELRQSNDSLELLYQTSQLINQADNTLDLTPITNKLAQITHKADIDLCLTTEQSNMPYEHIITKDKELADRCQIGDCESCITDESANDGCAININKMEIRYPIKKDDINYGVLVCNLDSQTPIESWQHQLFSSMTTLIANGLHTRQQTQQGRRITLLQERNVIARELHDSLAQALSYLKIQVSRLQKLRKKEASETQIEDVILELKTGLNSAYRQLRELLTTFRLKIDMNGLEQTFIQTIQQLNDRANNEIDFSLDYNIQSLPLTPNEEIHLMQIAREATQNALHHSKGEKALVSVFADDSKNIHLIIQDNGVGLPKETTKLNHYGLAIMKERSLHLKGEITMTNNDDGGARVELIFTPDYLKSAAKIA